MNKLYYFSGNDETGVFVGAQTWKEARKVAISHECMDGYEFTEIRGHMCREDGKPVLTELAGEHEADDLIKAGYTSFWWTGDCEICGIWSEHLNLVDGKLICYDCENPEEEMT